MSDMLTPVRSTQFKRDVKRAGRRGKGADPRRFTDKHDREQWEKLQTLPNLIYTDGNAFSLWRNGDLEGKVLTLDGDIATVGAKLTAPSGLTGLFADFFQTPNRGGGMNGIYAMYFTGVAGSGHAVFVMKDGIIAGADAIGGLLDGSYTHVGEGNLEISVALKVPAGTSLVTGAVAERAPLTQQITTILPTNLGNGVPIGVQTPTGPVNVIFRRLRDIL